MQSISPLRYPGGKAKLASFITKYLHLNGLENGIYYEPFAGGAGVALSLLMEGQIKEIFLNDADLRIYSFWKSILNEPERFCKNIQSVPLTVEEYIQRLEICSEPEHYDQFELGFSVFFVNRCSHSGIIGNAGPIGGFEQTGKWKIDARFNRDNLCSRITTIAKRRDSIHFFNLDALDFLKRTLPRGIRRTESLVYLDPPYHINGHKLYLNYYNDSDHKALANYMKQQKHLPWIMTYDESPFIEQLYSWARVKRLELLYSLRAKRVASELLISPQKLRLPLGCK